MAVKKAEVGEIHGEEAEGSMRLTKKARQDLIDDYLHSTGRNMFLAPEFVEWLSGRPNHPAYGWFEWDDEDDEDEKAGHAFRVDQWLGTEIRRTRIPWVCVRTQGWPT